ncbi:hypothetical protein WR25_07216 isoform A [Diploscapter pachys]|uniref:Uncharacterized protein n=1 Tax=Diploscapter pachys TaxID=2018661 RepID=A0A2A2J1U9_9BILA|nr:hypothetical protein WR25_07216 isoform A [Diploscapter pachys]
MVRLHAIENDSSPDDENLLEYDDEGFYSNESDFLFNNNNNYHGYGLRGNGSAHLIKQGFFFGSDQEMLNAAELLERNFGVQFPEELDGTIDLQTGSANCCKFNRWGTLVAVGATDGRIYIFDFLTRGIVKTWNAHSLPITSLSWSRDGRRLLTAAADNNLMVWDVLTATKIHSIKYHHMITFAMFNPRNDKHALVLQLNSSPPLLQVFENPPYQKAIVCDVPLLSNEDTVQCVSYDRKGRYIITGTNKGKLIIYDAKTLKMVNWVKQNSTQSIKQIFVPMKCNSVLTNTGDRVIRSYNFDDLINLSKCGKGTMVEAKYKVQDMVNKAAWRAVCTDSDGYYICGATTKSHSLYVWDGSSGALIKILHGTKGETLNDVQWHPTRPVILSIAAGIISVWTQAHVENWSAFAPDFTELDENVKYVEKEGEFDLQDEDADQEEKKQDQDLDVEIDVVHLKPEEMMCSSDEVGIELA